jgi:hypothetical protein
LSAEKKVTIGIPMSKIQPLQAVLDIAHIPTFPFLKLHFSKTNKAQTLEVDVRVSPSLHKFLTQAFQGEETTVFIDLTAGIPLGVWGSEMSETVRLLAKLQLIEEVVHWASVSRQHIQMALTNSAPIPIKRSQSAVMKVKVAERMLKAAGLLSEVDANQDLFKVAQDVLQSGKKDLSTTIYRVAMAIYHAERFAGKPLLEGLEDTAKIYLNFTSDKSAADDFKGIVEIVKRKEFSARYEFVRTFMCFLIGVYVCNKVLVKGA